MKVTGKRTYGLQAAKKTVFRLVVALLCILLLTFLSLKIYLSTALPASQLSRHLTSYLQQGFKVASLDTSGGTLFLRGVRLENPEGFPAGTLAAADSVAIAPQWMNLLRGRQGFRLIALQGFRVNLVKNSSGAWNFARLQRLFAGKKPSGADTYIGELSVKDGTVQVQGQGVQGIDLQIFQLTSKGSRDSKLELAFQDAAHNSYLLKGRLRAGTDPALDLALTAPALSLKNAAVLMKLKNPELFAGGTGALRVNAVLHRGELSSSGELFFSGLRMPVAGKTDPVSGVLRFAGDYSTRKDAARLQAGSLTINDLVKLHAKGSASGLKSERDFVLEIGMDELDLSRLNSLLPEERRKQLFFGGRLRCDSLRLQGSGSKGLKSATGNLQLQEGSLSREGRLLVAGLSGGISFSRKDANLLAKGRFSLAGPREKALLEELDLPFALTASPRLKPLSADIPRFASKIMGIPIGGRVAFDASKASPLTASLKVPASKVSSLDALLDRFDLQAASGTASATLEVSGKSAQELSATANLQLSDLRGTRGKTSFAAKNGSVTARMQKKGGRMQAQGDAKLTAIVLNGKAGDARFSYRIADDMLYLERAEVSAAGAELSFSRLSARIPRKPAAGTPLRYPVSIDLAGLVIKQRETQISNLSGRVRGSFNSDSAGKWFEGTADLASQAASWQGKTVAAPRVRSAFSRSGGSGELTGKLLGGKLAGTFSFNPLATKAGATFELRLTGAGLAAAAQLFAKSAGLYPSGGLLDLQLAGGYSGAGGLTCRFQSKGSGIALAGKGGKTLVSGAGLSLSGALASGKLSVSEAVLSAGQGVALRLKGELAQAFSPERSGSFSFSVPEAPLNALVDPFVNMLPRFIQEATLDGTLAAAGKVELQEGRTLIEGGVNFQGGRLEVASQKLLVEEINGRLPFSLDFSGNGGGRPPSAISFSRENYARVLEELQKGGGGQLFTVGKIGLGALELGKLTLRVKAGNGLTQITSLKTSLYEGALLGRGYLTMQEQLQYRGDLLVNGLSMRALCNTLPNLSGYISGRVDGVLSLSGTGKGLKGVTGFTDLWAREGSGEKMLVSKEFLQRLSKQKLSGLFFSSDRRYDEAEIKAMLEEGDLTFNTLKIVNTNLFGVRDLSVSIAPTQNRISVEHLLASIQAAALRGKPTASGEPAEAPITQEFKWGE